MPSYFFSKNATKNLEELRNKKKPDSFEKIMEIRANKNFNIKMSEYHKSDVKLRNYQSVGVYNLIAVTRLILGDDTGLGKTVESLSAYAHVKQAAPDTNLLIVCPKSSLYQWKNEVYKFFNGLEAEVVQTITKKIDGKKFSTKESRFYQYEKHLNDGKIIIINYNSLIDDYEFLQEKLGKYVAIFDEASAFKSSKTKTYVAVKSVAHKAKRAYGLTATVIMNRLEEAFNIFTAIVPGFLPNKTTFGHCFYKQVMMDIWIKGRPMKIPKIVGYKNLDIFRDLISPYYLGRKKHEVAKELPTLTTKKVLIDLNPKQRKIYIEALSGLIKPDEGEEKEITKLSSLIYCQQIANAPAIVGIDIKSEKETEFVRLVEEELAETKIIVYTRFKKCINRLEKLLKTKNIKSTRITGDEGAKTRSDNMEKFRSDKDLNVILINDAGTKGVNLQMADTIVFFDMPWSYGELLQIIGRTQRIGSKFEKNFLIFLICNDTVDEAVMAALEKKKELFDYLFGNAAKGLDFADDKTMLGAIYDSVKEKALQVAKRKK